MRYKTLGKSSLLPSVLGIGGLHFGVYCDQVATTNIIHKAIDLGINFIDTAPLYGNGESEKLIGKAIRGCRNKVIISTKVGLKPVVAPGGIFGVAIDSLTRGQIRSSLEKSLLALGTDCIDLYQLHAFDPNTTIEETLGELNDLIHEGKVRFIGCSNYDQNEFELYYKTMVEHKWSEFVSFQVHYNLTERKAEDNIIPLCQKRNVGIICNRVLARGILTGKYKYNEPLPPESRASTSIRIRRLLSKDNLQLVSVLGEFSQVRNRTSTELAIAWLLSRKVVSVALVGVRNLEQLDLCAKAADWELSDKELLEIDKIVENLGLMPKLKEAPETFFER